jgi:hypothetical protein
MRRSLATLAALAALALPAGAQHEHHAADAAMQTHAAASPHLRLSPARPATAADSARARAIVAELRGALAPYADTAAAVADGYRMFAPGVKQQRVYHFTKRRHALRNELGFDAARPTSLLYARGADGRLRLTGAMYTAPRRASPDDLDARVPLSLARWHLHTNVCVPPRGARERWRETRNGRMLFGPAGDVATRADCDAAGGRFHAEVLNWMVHVDPFAADIGSAFGDHH